MSDCWVLTVFLGRDTSAEVRQLLKKTKLDWMAATCPSVQERSPEVPKVSFEHILNVASHLKAVDPNTGITANEYER